MKAPPTLNLFVPKLRLGTRCGAKFRFVWSRRAGVVVGCHSARTGGQDARRGRRDARPTQGRAGFTLVEVMAALLFLAIAIPAILGAISASSRSSEAAERSAIAGQLAENQLSQLVIDQSNTTGTAATSSADRGDFGADFPGYRWEMKQESWTTSSDLTQYTVQVFFSVRGVERSVELSTLLSQSNTTP